MNKTMTQGPTDAEINQAYSENLMREIENALRATREAYYMRGQYTAGMDVDPSALSDEQNQAVVSLWRTFYNAVSAPVEGF